MCHPGHRRGSRFWSRWPWVLAAIAIAIDYQSDQGIGAALFDRSGPSTDSQVDAAFVGAENERQVQGTVVAATDDDGDGSETGSGEAKFGSAGDASGVAVWVDPASSQEPWRRIGAEDGMLTFRGNPTRSFYGVGPVPAVPEVVWESDIGCSISFVGSEAKQWCGTGWTGQPLVFRPPTAADEGADDWWIAVGGYNKAVNFFDPADGGSVYPKFATNDIIKGTASVDPDGFPLLYTGSRDDYLHIVALDRSEPTELWTLSSRTDLPTLWNNDWDSSPLILDDLLIIGGENSRFYVVKLNRAFDDDGLVTVDPTVVFSTEGWDAQLLADLGDKQVSIEGSVAVSGSVAYFSNSGGLVQGWDLAPLVDGAPPERVFRFWTGDDTDATVVVDENGQVYVGSEYERGSARANELGQIFRLDPSNPDDPLVWSIEANSGIDTGIWATPALYKDLVIVSTDDGRVLGIDREDGTIRWTLRLGSPLWSSPVVVDDTLIQGDCEGRLHAFGFDDEQSKPRRLWTLPLDGCIESTPVVWDGQIFVGTRSGSFYGIGDTRPDLSD